MGQVLVEYEGSKPGTQHQIIRGADGVVYCSCWAWKMNKRCKHLDRFFSKYDQYPSGVRDPHPPTLPTPVATGVAKTADELIASIDPKFWDIKGGAK